VTESPDVEKHVSDQQRDEQLARLLAELTDRLQEGEQVEIDAVCQEYPTLAQELRELWGATMVVDAIGSGPDVTVSPGVADYDSGAFSLPCRFGDFELLEQIGQGGMGVVYRARQISLNREVAVKMILRGSLATDTDRKRFRAEAEAAAKLDHPGIVPVYEVGERDGRPFFCMKFVKGRTLTELVSRGPLPPREAARILSQIARAIQFAHENGVLHRDLKPSNILIDEAGEAHVTDFGLAKQDSTAISLTRSGVLIGTPSYMAPEQAAGIRAQIGPTTDVYGLGCLLYYMLTGVPPFQAATDVPTVIMVREQDPTPPRVVNPAADRDLELIAMRCLQKPPDLRYESAAALADDVEAFLKDEPMSVRSGRFGQFLVRLFRETHHATILENWGLLWMWHSLALFTACLLTNALYWWDVRNRWSYAALWTLGFWTWAAVFWALRRRMGPVTFVERQIAHVWAGSTIAIALLFPLEWKLGLPVLKLSPVLGLINGLVFLVKAGILSGSFYIQSVALFATAGLMALFPDFAHLIFGAVSAACFLIPGIKYYRQRRVAVESLEE